jgi:7-carboxy-7-deazaguanine synthase
MVKKNLWKNVDCLRSTDEVKFVISDREDFDWAAERIREFDLNRRSTVLLSPVFGVLDPLQLANWMLEEKMNARLQLQLHKYIWEPDTRGV